MPPCDLHKKHLLAEHRELIRIPNAIKKGRYRLKGIPDNFKLGRGHVKFFYNKLRYLHFRYRAIYNMCKRHNFNVTDYSESFKNLPVELYNDYTPTEQDLKIIKQRIKERQPKK